MGRVDDALKAITDARMINPSSPMIHGTAGWVLHFARRHSEAIDSLEQTTKYHPRFPPGYVMLGLALEADEQHDQAIKAFQSSFDLQPGPVALASIIHAYATAGKQQRARTVLKQLLLLAKVQWVSPYFFALVHAGFGEIKPALTCLDKAAEERCDWMIHLGVEPRWDCLRSERQFKELLERVGILPFVRDKRKRGIRGRVS
jgi:tetratricopeptide (TPR) repeat protein